jgi:hypothetical protein
MVKEWNELMLKIREVFLSFKHSFISVPHDKAVFCATRKDTSAIKFSTSESNDQKPVHKTAHSTAKISTSAQYATISLSVRKQHLSVRKSCLCVRMDHLFVRNKKTRVRKYFPCVRKWYLGVRNNFFSVRKQVPLVQTNKNGEYCYSPLQQ